MEAVGISVGIWKLRFVIEAFRKGRPTQRSKRVAGGRVDGSGRHPRVSELPEPAASVFQVQYGAVADLRAAVYAEHDAPSSISSLVRWCRLALPLSDDEDRIRRLLVVNVTVDRSR